MITIIVLAITSFTMSFARSGFNMETVAMGFIGFFISILITNAVLQLMDRERT